jgi:hypothetical protein
LTTVPARLLYRDTKRNKLGDELGEGGGEEESEGEEDDNTE